MSEENKQVYSPLTYEQIKVKEILLMPIRADKNLNNNEIFMHNGIIYSSQRFNSVTDPDMSDISVAFYEIIYNNTLHKESDSKSFSVLREYKKGEKLPNGETAKNPIYDFTNPDVAGDTMNSYNSVAKKASEAKRREWYLRYHCLANFWLIPYSIGRTSMKWSKYDSLDLFLNAINDKDNRMNKYSYYFESFQKPTYEQFLDNHYLTGYKTLVNKENDKNLYEDNPDEVINKMIECIELRADNIVRNEEICNKLYDFFKGKKLL